VSARVFGTRAPNAASIGMNKEALAIITVPYIYNGCRSPQSNQKSTEYKANSARWHGGGGRVGGDAVGTGMKRGKETVKRSAANE